jgi:hypothetical protein
MWRRFERRPPDPRRRRLDLAAARADLLGRASIVWDLGFRNTVWILRARGCSPVYLCFCCSILIRAGVESRTSPENFNPFAIQTINP